MNEQEKQVIYSILMRLIDNGETLTPTERRDLLNQLCMTNCDMNIDEILHTTQNNRKLRIKRGTTSQNDSYTGQNGEITMDTDAGTIRIHDGETVGGVALARAADLVGDWVVDSQLPTAENNYTWYRKYKSSWVEMGGYIQNSQSGKSVSLPIKMANEHYNIHIQSQMTGYGSSTNTGSVETSQTSFTHHHYNDTNQNWYWFVSGISA